MLIKFTFWLMLIFGIFGVAIGTSVAYNCIKAKEEGKPGPHHVIEVLGLIMAVCSIMIIPFQLDIRNDRDVKVVGIQEFGESWSLIFEDEDGRHVVPGAKLGDKNNYQNGDHIVISYGRINSLANIINGDYNLLKIGK